jgi:hypothetical protein
MVGVLADDEHCLLFSFGFFGAFDDVAEGVECFFAGHLSEPKDSLHADSARLSDTASARVAITGGHCASTVSKRLFAILPM